MNLFYDYFAAGQERRIVEYKTGGLPDPDEKIPVEWNSWLHHVRQEAPTAELSAKLAKERETRKQNAIKWEEEQQRRELQAQMMGNSPSQQQDTNLSMINAGASSLMNLNTVNSPSTASTSQHSVNIQQHRRAEGANPLTDPSQYKAVDTTNMTSEQTRDVMKLYSQVRTSPFLGKKPQVRQNSFKEKSMDESTTDSNKPFKE